MGFLSKYPHEGAIRALIDQYEITIFPADAHMRSRHLRTGKNNIARFCASKRQPTVTERQVSLRPTHLQAKTRLLALGIFVERVHRRCRLKRAVAKRLIQLGRFLSALERDTPQRPYLCLQ